MELNLETLGISKTDLQERVIERLCEEIMSSVDLDEEGNEGRYASKIATDLKDIVKKRIDSAVSAFAEAHLLPHIDKLVNEMDFTPTSRYGEPKGEKTTFKEFLAKSAEAYIVEKVNYEGKGKGEDNYSWTGTQTRITHLIHKHFHYEIEKTIKAAMVDANSKFAAGIHETCRLKLNEMLASLKVGVQVGN